MRINILNSLFEKKIKNYENLRVVAEMVKVAMMTEETEMVMMTTEVQRKVTQNVSRYINVFVNVIKIKTKNELFFCKLHVRFEISKDLKTKEI